MTREVVLSYMAQTCCIKHEDDCKTPAVVKQLEQRRSDQNHVGVSKDLTLNPKPLNKEPQCKPQVTIVYYVFTVDAGAPSSHAFLLVDLDTHYASSLPKPRKVCK